MSEPAEPELEFEAMVRITFADQGTKEEALATVDAIARQAELRYREGLAQLGGHLTDGGPFPDRLHLIALTATFHADLLRLLLDWAARARAEIEDWPTTAGLGLTSSARQMIEAMLERGRRDLEERRQAEPGMGGSAPDVAISRD